MDGMSDLRALGDVALIVEGSELGVFRWFYGAVVLIIVAVLDSRDRRVPNAVWVITMPGAAVLVGLDLQMRGADIATWGTSLAAFAWVCIHVIGRPTWQDARSGSWPDIVLGSAIGAGALCTIWGIWTHLPSVIEAPWILIEPLDTTESMRLTRVWLMAFSMVISIPLIEMLWRLGALRGGADAKALMMCVLILPTWSGVPIIATPPHLSAPFISLAIWSGILMLSVPIHMVIKNISAGTRSPVGMIWHATMIDLDDFNPERQWLLTNIASSHDGETGPRNRMRPVSRSREEEWTEQAIEDLNDYGESRVWVTHKHPYLVYMCLGWILLLLCGDAVGHVAGWMNQLG